MLEVKNKFIFVISGSLGSGKTTIGQKLKEKIKRTAVYDMDDIKWQISDFVKGDHDNLIVRKAVLKLAENYIDNDINVIIPQTFEKGEVDWYKKLAKDKKVRFLHIELYANDEDVLERIKNRKKKNPSPLKRTLEKIEWFKNNNHLDWNILKINTSNYDINNVFELVWEEFNNKIVKE